MISFITHFLQGLTFYHLWHSIYLPDLELKMLLAQTREITCLLQHHLVILLLGVVQSDGVIYFLCQLLWFTVGLAFQSTVWLGDSLHAAVVIRGVRNSTVLWVLEPRSLYRGSPYALTIVLTERVLIWEYSVVILIPGRQNVITVEWGEFAVVILRSRSPHLPFVWLFQH